MLFAVLLGCGQSGFEPLDGGDPGRLSGRVLTSAGQPANARVFLVGEQRAISFTDTGDDGTFIFDEAPSGTFEIFAHGRSEGAALIEMTLQGPGDNRAGDLILSPFNTFPRLVDYRGIELEERLTRGEGYLVGPLPREVLGRDPAPGHAHFRRTIAWFPTARDDLLVVDVEIATGVETVEAAVPRGSAGEVVAGFLFLEPVDDGRSVIVRRLSTMEQIARFDASPHRWVERFLLEDGSVVFLEVVDLERDENGFVKSYRQRLVKIGRDDVTYGATLAPEKSIAGIDPIARIEDALYFIPDDDCYTVECAAERFTIQRADLRTLEVADVVTIESRAPRFRAVQVPGASEIAVSRKLADGSFAISRIELTTGAAKDVVLSSASDIEMVAAFRDSLFWIEKHASGEVLRRLDAGGAQDLRAGDGLTLADAGEEHLLIRERDRSMLLSVTLIEIGSGAFRRIDLEQPIDGVGRIAYDVDEPCIVRLLPGGRAFLSQFVTTEDGAEHVTVEATIADPPRGRRWRTTPLAPLEPSIRPNGADVELLHAPDAAGHIQLHIGPIGAPREAFEPLTYLEVDYREFVGIDQSAVYFIAPDPISGYSQLFRRELERSAP